MRKTAKQSHRNAPRTDVFAGKQHLKLDETVYRISSLLQNARVSTTELSRRVKMPPSRIVEGLRKLEENKIILRYETRLDGSALGANWLRSYS